MSEIKVPEKVSTGTQKAKSEKSEVGAKGTNETTKTAESSPVEKTESAPKSASQTSISHFSSVSTPAYKEGWNNIFGGAKSDRSTASKPDDGGQLPETLTIQDADIDKELRSMLYKVFQRRARAQGINLAQIKKQVDFEYIVDCNLKKK